MVTQLSIFDLQPATVSFSRTIRLHNEGQNEPGIDASQWAPATRKVYEVMRSGKWMTLAEVSHFSGYPEASVSARIRDLDRLKGIPHEKRKAKEGSLYQYRLVL